MNPIRLKGLTPDEFERLCLELVQKSFHAAGTRCGGISDPDQGVDIEATIGSHRLGVQCKTGRLTVGILRDTLRQLIRHPHRIDRRSGRSLVYKLTGRLNYGVEPLRCGRRPIRFVKKQTKAAKRPVGVRMAACKEGSAD